MAELSELSTAVMTHPLRRRLAEKVVDSLCALDPAVAVDPEPLDTPRTLRTSIQAWDSVRTGAAYHLVIQDDVLPSKHFAEHVADILAYDPEHPIALFSVCYSRNGWAVRWASAWGARLVAGVPEYVPCVALLLPADAARHYVHFARAWDNADTPDDYVMRAYFAEAGLKLLLSVPSLVEHRPVRSLIGNDFLAAAACFGDPRSGWFRDGGPVLDGYQVLPVLKDDELWLCRKDACSTRQDDWGAVPFEAEAHRIGVDLDDLMDRYNRFLVGVPDSLVDQWFTVAHPRVLWTAWLAAYLLRNYHPPRKDVLTGPDSVLLDSSLRTILSELLTPEPISNAPIENLDLLFPVVADGFATVGHAITPPGETQPDGVNSSLTDRRAPQVNHGRRVDHAAMAQHGNAVVARSNHGTDHHV
ncbi:hypothetical protein SAMN05421805_102508 [Saccharopolyspora antimicrobica]|uniref:Uncharacterized protein n=1 Tax=Saccharopolyspora antimicrobica TaxID=455193 RepID=A0A1I4W2S9_9PSEU|nr:hypothetical protein [Saccharopolyspora antimicrobica]RKT87091.1 hypothetical protein ATL45_5479 [Saccharopolyspora antimicrobica]SFN07848.1 hypothetical protein SAMN05421805_102508 [Saccharopolyspora antimicrobica]